MRENAASKAVRLLAERRVAILRAGPDGITALVRGDSAAFYWVEYDSEHHRWSCTCPAIGRCSHALAVQGCTVVDWFQPPLELQSA